MPKTISSGEVELASSALFSNNMEKNSVESVTSRSSRSSHGREMPKTISSGEVELASSALFSNNMQKLSEVLHRAANPGLVVNSLISSGMTVLGQAVSTGNAEAVRICLREPSRGKDERTARSSSGSPRLKQNAAISPKACRDSVLCPQTRSSSFERRTRVDINRTDFFDRSPLHYAAELESSDILNLLIERGASVNSSDANCMTPLHVSVYRGRLTNVEILISNGARLSGKSIEKQTPLHMAASYGHLEICAALLRAGAQIDALDSSERTPLMLALQHKHLKIMKLLIDHGANVNAREIHGESPIVASVWANDAEVVDLLLRSGARNHPSDGLLQTAIYHHSPHMVKILLPYTPVPLPRNTVGETPQLVAIKEKQFDIFLILVNHGADLSIRSSISGETLLHILVETFAETFDLPLFRNFLKILVQLNFDLMDSETCVQGETALFMAVKSSKLKFSMLLVANGCDPNAGHAFTYKNIDVLRIARNKGSLELVRLLIDAGYDLRKGIEPLPLTVTPRDSPVEKFLADACRTPLALRKIARLSVRRLLKRPLEKSLRQISLPVMLKDFLQFSDHVELL
ncbi:ankyrin-1 [Galendromus occidentalis]|uniref:Ankyrin-1 n=1 Tax=Galendromus occidentalis TaxID=34638 RepID=A0AAJ6QYI6_9ACAR|nr:ankyrin-1 [Galendromus occidentalis]